MKKRILSILLLCCMVLTLLPTAAFAEGSEEELPICTCETACTAESMNAACPVCGAEGALPENCAKCAQPADAAAVQPVGKVSDPQPEAALTGLIGGNPTERNVSSESELTLAIEDSTVSTVKLTANIDISSSLTVKRTVTLDLNGYVLKYHSTNKGSVIVVEVGGNLTLTDSNTTAEHKFTPNDDGLWVLDENGSKTVSGGVITGGTGYPFPLSSTVYCGGGVYIAPGGQLTMTGGNIIGCSAEFGGGVCIYPRQDSKQGQFSMSGGSIIGCSAEFGGGVYASGKFQMSGQAVIRSCTAEGTSFNCGGGVNVDGSFEMSGEAIIEGCQAISEYAYGGGVYVNSSSSFVMTDKAEIEGCQAISTPSSPSKGGGVHLANNTKFTLSGSAVIQKCKADNSDGSSRAYGGGVSAANVREITLADSARIADCIAANGSGLYITGSQVDPADYGKLLANGGSVEGDVVLGEANNPCTVIGSGGTVFNGKVTVTPGSTIEKGTFNGEVINNGTITGGTFNGTVNNNGTINDGTFNGEVTNNGTINDGTFNTPITGSGTKDDPYQISTAAQLKLFRDIVNGANGQTQNPAACAKLTNDIVLNDGTFDENGKYTTGASGKAVETWTPIAYSGPFTVDTTLYYTGTFDGQGHAIKGMYVSINDTPSIEDQVCLGLFSTAKNAVIRNVTVTGYVSGYAGNLGGIVGYLAGGTIENCANYCTVTDTSAAHEVPSYVGGIAGAVNCSAAIRDCYNTGKLTEYVFVRYHKTGGIVGYIGSSAVSNCYNVGKVAGKGWCNGEIIGFIAGEDEEETPSTINNCYYLNTTNEAVGNDADTVTNTGPKTAVQFGNGTVLALLINGRADSAHPWNSQCKYLAAAGRTLPVFKTQTGDAHTHDWSAWTSNGDSTHSRRCTCNAAETVNCSGGTATCTAKAKCADCGAEYGDTNPNHHGDKLKHVVAKDATTSEEGNIEYWYCEACEKYFFDADAKNEITQAQTVIPKRQSSGSNYSYYTIKATAGTGGSISPSGNVSVRGGRDQTFTITPDKGYTVSNVKIDGKSIGAVKSYTFENVRRTHTIEVSFMKANGNPQTGVFVDVATGSYYEDAVDWAVENGITKGTDDTHFSPDGICTRAQAVTFLWRAAGSPAPETRTMPFTDIPVGSYYYDAVLWAVENGITKGTGDTTFSPNMTCSRAQIVAFLWRSEKSPASGTVNPFADVKSTAYYADAVLWAVKKDITKGTTNTTFSPDADCTRAQIVTFLWRCKK